jgi:hypothetical protein
MGVAGYRFARSVGVSIQLAQVVKGLAAIWQAISECFDRHVVVISAVVP